MNKLLIGGAATLCLVACASSPSTSTAQNAAAPAGNPAERTALAEQADEDDPIVCKGDRVTGTRVRKAKSCRRQSEWDRITERSQQAVDSNFQNRVGVQADTSLNR
jgi:hypothetical protein